MTDLRRNNWRQFKKSHIATAWAVRGGRCVDIDGSIYNSGYLGWRWFDPREKIPKSLSGQNIALFATRDSARRAMKAGPKKSEPGVWHERYCCYPNACVERVTVMISRKAMA